MELNQLNKPDCSRAQYFSEDLNPRRFNPIELIKAAREGVGLEFEWGLEKMLEHLDHSQQIYEIHSESELLTGLIYFRALPGGLEIDYVFSSPEFRRQGVIKRLFQKLLWRMEPGDELWLEVHQDNIGAKRLYEVLGMQEKGRRCSYYSDKKDAILYTYRK